MEKINCAMRNIEIYNWYSKTGYKVQHISHGQKDRIKHTLSDSRPPAKNIYALWHSAAASTSETSASCEVSLIRGTKVYALYMGYINVCCKKSFRRRWFEIVLVAKCTRHTRCEMCVCCRMLRRVCVCVGLWVLVAEVSAWSGSWAWSGMRNDAPYSKSYLYIEAQSVGKGCAMHTKSRPQRVPS